MAKFAKPEKQAASGMKLLQGGIIRSVGTVRNYEQALTRVCEWIKSERLGSLREITTDQAIQNAPSCEDHFFKVPKVLDQESV